MIDGHEKAVLQISGGKDSLCVLHMLREYWPKITVMWVNTGAAYPETIEQMEKINAMVPNFMEVKADQSRNLESMGLPVDVLPVRETIFGHSMEPEWGGPLLQSRFLCCDANMWQPLYQAVKATGATLVIRGQRKSEKLRSAINSGHVLDGITYWFPIEDRSEEEVLRWLAEHEIELPQSYRYLETSLDCWSCTAYTEANAGKMRHLKAKHPDKYAHVRGNLDLIIHAAERELEHVRRAMVE